MSFNFRLYQYRPDQHPRDLEMLVSKQLWFSKVDKLNDPFEFLALHALTSHPQKLAEFKNAGVTCFCRSLTNPLLWSHYAASHVGFAVGYDTANSFFGGGRGSKGRALLDVRYEDVIPTLDTYSIDDLAMAAVLTKPTCWAYEQEVRMVLDNADQAMSVPPESIKEVIFGAKMPIDRVDVIIDAVKTAGIVARFAQMEFLREGYGVKPRWITS